MHILGAPEPTAPVSTVNDAAPMEGSEVLAMKAFVTSFVVGALVGVLYAVLRIKSPAPPLVALAGLFGMVLGEGAYPAALRFLTSWLGT